jgi:hypothetical protein
MQKRYLQQGKHEAIVFSDTPATRRLKASMKDGRVVLLDQHSCAVFYRNHSEIMKLRDIAVKRDKAGYYVIM